ncbi:MAG: hypothetical protein H6736_16565 [Alphaproteobacteria bacterium]|nr:hypothetical protein [Alphaproteobacteria bacterium]MCB9693428.1 hypothetical protein [Alphaproteobacteria bacterium]
MRWTLVFLPLIACKSVPKETRLADLSDDDALALCEEFHRREHTLSCGGDPIVIPETDDQVCVDRILDIPVTCQATAADYRACMRARDADDACLPSTEILEPCAWEVDSSCFQAF